MIIRTESMLWRRIVSSVVALIVLLLVCCGGGEAKICGEVDIRSDITEFEKLNGCTVIVGSLSILLMEKSRAEDFERYSFPDLTEINGYFMVYRVFGLRTLANLFPNLSVIRGQTLFQDFAFVLFELQDLEEIGLYKLSTIQRGGSRIDNCRKLCFMNTVNWTRIQQPGSLIKHFPTNPHEEQCGKCKESCEGGFCWNEANCQFLSRDCHPECIGCSQPGSAEHCYACKKYRDNGICVSSCPENKYIHEEISQCVSEQECRTLMNGTWFIFQRKCLKECPDNYQSTTPERGHCEPCKGRCKKVCSGRLVDSLGAVQALHGCTHINGSLTIRDSSDKNIRQEFETNLESIEEIDGYLKITRTFSLQSLSFLKNLRIITGKVLENKNYSLVLLENENLYKLWDVDDKKFNLTLLNGTLSFHNNPQLCPKEIERLAEKLGLKKNIDFTSIEKDNGDRFNCTNAIFNMDATNISSRNVTIQWDDFKSTLSNALIGYFLYWIEIPDYEETQEEVNLFEREEDDLCKGFGTFSKFTTTNSVQITNLQPYTRYAYYVKTYLTNSVGNWSQQLFFRTLSENPSIMIDVTTISTSYDSVLLEWTRPLHPNGNLSHYVLKYRRQVDDKNVILQRDYCVNTYIPMVERKLHRDNNTGDGCCVTRKPKIPSFLPWLQEPQDIFSNLCMNLTDPYSGDCSNYVLQVHEGFSSDGFEYTLTIDNSSATEYNVTNLEHYSLYVFYISACNKAEGEPVHCGPVTMVSQRTLKKEDADDIPEHTIRVERVDGNTVLIVFGEPLKPNALVLAYNIEYRTMSTKSVANQSCITYQRHKAQNYSPLRSRPFFPGRYSFTVSATSLAGPGRKSKPVEFEIVAQSQSSTTTITISILIVLLLLFAVVFGFYVYFKKKHDDIRLITSVNPDYTVHTYIEDDWEMDRSNIEINNELGQGTFGMVYNGLIKPANIPCAIKTVNDHATVHDRLDFLNEASVMKAFNNSHHVVRLLGVVSRGDPPLVIMELMERGDLKSYLRRSRDSSNNITCVEMYKMAAEIADGMAYLAAKKYVHRDLAARNCMVAADRTVKIGDFGMARDIYETDYYRKESKGLLPVRWMAPESLADGVFTSDSDVWSYGIVLWEMSTLAEQPYQGLSNEEVLQFVTTKGTLVRPAECTQVLWDIMEKCWMWRPIDRPLFSDIVNRLESCVGQAFRLVSFYHSREGEDHRLNAGPRVYNPPAVSAVMDRVVGTTGGAHWNISDDDVSLYPDEVADDNQYLPYSYQRC